jgi:hypothetical protein
MRPAQTGRRLRRGAARLLTEVYAALVAAGHQYLAPVQPAPAPEARDVRDVRDVRTPAEPGPAEAPGRRPHSPRRLPQAPAARARPTAARPGGQR